MGWSIRYHVDLPHPLSPAEQESVWRLVGDSRWTLDPASEPFDLCHLTAGDLGAPLVPPPGSLWGATKIQSSRTPGHDYAVVLAALRALVSRFPGSRVTVSDDYYLDEVSLEEIDADALRRRIEQEPTRPQTFATREQLDAFLDAAAEHPALAARRQALQDPATRQLHWEIQQRVARRLRGELNDGDEDDDQDLH